MSADAGPVSALENHEETYVVDPLPDAIGDHVVSAKVIATVRFCPFAPAPHQAAGLSNLEWRHYGCVEDAKDVVVLNNEDDVAERSKVCDVVDCKKPGFRDWDGKTAGRTAEAERRCKDMMREARQCTDVYGVTMRGADGRAIFYGPDAKSYIVEEMSGFAKLVMRKQGAVVGTTAICPSTSPLKSTACVDWISHYVVLTSEDDPTREKLCALVDCTRFGIHK